MDKYRTAINKKKNDFETLKKELNELEIKKQSASQIERPKWEKLQDARIILGDLQHEQSIVEHPNYFRNMKIKTLLIWFISIIVALGLSAVFSFTAVLANIPAMVCCTGAVFIPYYFLKTHIKRRRIDKKIGKAQEVKNESEYDYSQIKQYSDRIREQYKSKENEIDVLKQEILAIAAKRNSIIEEIINSSLLDQQILIEEEKEQETHDSETVSDEVPNSFMFVKTNSNTR